MVTIGDDGRHDVDFIFGDWTIRNRKLLDAADLDCSEWIEFVTTSRVELMFDGLAHFERISAGPQTPEGPWEGFTLRQFDPRERQWRIWWASSRRPGHLDPPLTGQFRDGVGEFLGEDTLDGQPIEVRRTHPAPGQGSWSQEFSHDAGRTWRLNWTMDFSAV
jgi:hypothetical protein